MSSAGRLRRPLADPREPTVSAGRSPATPGQLEGQQAAAARGNHGGRPNVIDEDSLILAQALRERGVPIPQIAKKLVIKTGKNAGKNPSVATLYRTLATLPDPGPPAPPVHSATAPPADRPEHDVEATATALMRPAGRGLTGMDWPAGYRPACPTCDQPTTGIHEARARVPGRTGTVIVARLDPCDCDAAQHSVTLQQGALRAARTST